MGEEGDPGLAEFQKGNCADCKFADPRKVGTGLPCCTRLEQAEIIDGLCFSNRRKGM